MGVFLPIRALPGLKKYQYAGEDRSLVSRYILKPFYAQFVKLFPRWFAPNLITLSGFSFVVANIGLMLYYNPTLDQEYPTWVYWCFALSLFMYQTFDACDGSQARRTGQSGPLGELFDHCVDACNTTLEVLIFSSVTTLGYGWPVIISQFGTLFNFYLTTWEEYHTGVLFLSAFSGPVEGILIIIACYAVTGIYGPGIWHLKVVEQLGIEHYVGECEILHKLSFNDAYLVFAGVGLLFNIVQSTSNVLKARKRAGLRKTPALVQTLPFLIFYATVVGWIYLEPRILHHYVLPLVITIGASFALTVGRMILAHVSKQPFPVWNPLLLLPSVGIMAHSVGVVLGWDSLVTGLAVIYAGLGLSVGIYGCFIAEVVSEITEYLDIWCLSIKHPIDIKKDQ